MPAPARVIWSLADWCDAITGLPAETPLPQRTVLVPNGRVAHALRRRLIDSGRTAVLAGTQFVPLGRALAELLAAAGEPIAINEEQLRPARLHAVFAAAVELEYFDAGAMRTTPGWIEAWCRTLHDLEGAGLSPSSLPNDHERWRDVARVWSRVNRIADGLSVNQAMARAAELLDANPAAWPYAGPTLITATPHASAVEARLCAAIVGAELVLLAGRPLRNDTRARVAALFGPEASAALAVSVPSRASESERAILATYLFEQPDRLLDPERPRSRGRDDTVALEEHAGIEEELEAAVTWVADRVRAGTALDQIGLLLPALDPLAALVVQRLDRLPECPPVFVAGGLPITTIATGARVLAVVRALREWLSAETLATLAPHLKQQNGEPLGMSASTAVQTIWSVGTGGGSHAQQRASLRWPERLAIRIADLDIEIASRSVLEDDAVQSGSARETRAARELADRLRALQPAVQDLATLAGQVLAGASITTLARSLAAWLEQYLFVPEEHEAVLGVIAEALDELAAADPSGALTGPVALRVIAETVEQSRVRVGRYGEPAIYVGTIRGALGLSFSATRVLGLAEGTLPAATREDPILPESLRIDAGLPLPRASHANLLGLHALDWAVRNTERVCLSAPRCDASRTSKEPSSVFVEVATALGRGPERVVSTGDLRQHCFAPARAHLARLRHDGPLSEAAWLDRLARSRDLLPPAWTRDAHLDLERTRTLHGATSGILGRDTPTPTLPGLSAERAISPTRLGSLLGCPLRFLMESLLGWSAPAAPPLQRQIAQPYYGSLLHLAHETFFDRYGAAFGARERSLEHWLRVGANLADQAFERFLHEYPLTGDAVRAQQRQRLLDDFGRLLTYDWDHGTPRTFHSTEQGFGFDVPLALQIAGRTLFVRGRIDRIDTRNGVTQIRDLKSGKPHPRTGDERGPHPGVDLQIALYTMVARARAGAWQLPGRFEVAYVYPRTDVRPERAFTDDIDELLTAAEGWMAIGHDLMSARSFPQTPDAHGCDFCDFAPVCSANAAAEPLAAIDASEHPELAAFADLYGEER